MVAPQHGATYTLSGNWQNSKYGKTFVFDFYTVELPKDTDAIVRYLSITCRGIGPSTARLLANAFGSETLQVLRTDPHRAAESVNGFSLALALKTQQTLIDNERMEAVTVGLTDLFTGTQIGQATVTKCLDKWRHEALETVREDPFKLTELRGIGFELADRVRAKLGIEMDAPSRIRAGILHVLEQATQGDGHTYLPDHDFLARARRVLYLTDDAIQSELEAMEAAAQIHVRRAQYLGAVVYDIALADVYEAEMAIAGGLLALAAAPHRVPPSADVASLTGLFDDQVQALSQGVGAKVFALTGPPGTGKTRTVRAFLEALPKSERIALAAPTGKAAQRMREMCERDAVTMHRLLEPMPQPGGRFAFARNADNPLPYDTVILDECSMIDVKLMASFVKAMPAGARLVLVGDTNQLPSVGPGNVLGDVLASGCFAGVELVTIKRQDPGLIVRNCHAVRAGRAIDCSNSDRDFFFEEAGEAELLAQTIVDFVARRIPAKFGFDAVRDIQVLVPLREKGAELSLDNLNRRLQAALNPNRPEGSQKFAVGDKVVQGRNDYAQGIFNGDVGIIRRIDTRERRYTVAFDAPQRDVEIPFKEAEFELAYALTVHRAQGSEWPAVVIPVHKSLGQFIPQRRWIYTAISRSRSVCVLVGQEAEAMRIVARTKDAKRNTRLARMLKEMASHG